MKNFCILSLLLLSFLPLKAQLAIGHWRDHLSFSSVYSVEASPSCIYLAGSMGLFYYDIHELTLNPLTKTTGLSDVGVSTMAYDDQSGYLVVAYSNGNVDLYRDEHVYNISDIKRASIDGDKSISRIRFYNRHAYLACSFGIVVIDLGRHEIENTFYLSLGDGHLNIHDLAFSNDKIVAATDSGMFSAAKDDPYLNMSSRWTRDNQSLLSGLPIIRLDSDGQSLLATTFLVDPAYRLLYRCADDGSCSLFAEGSLDVVRYSRNRWILLNNDTLKLFDNQFHLQEQYTDVSGVDLQINDVTIDKQNQLWVAHKWAGLLLWSDDRSWACPLTPNGPQTPNVFRLVPNGNAMLLCPGGITTTFANAYFAAELCTFSDNKWSTLADPLNFKSQMSDIVDVAVDPNDSSHLLAASWGYGIVDIRNNQIANIFNDANTGGALQPYQQSGFKTLRTGAVDFDAEGNAWIINSMQNQGLIKFAPDGTWKSFNISPMLKAGGQFDHLICDSIHDFKWFFGNKVNRVYLHDGVSRQAWVDPNHGSKLNTSFVNAITQDRSGEIWLGTEKGIKVIYDAYKAFDKGGMGEQSPVNCSNIIISKDGIDEYLMAYESITCFAVDGANRKWVGTAAGGLYLLSASGLEELQHFTASNSPLYSDKIVCLAINPVSGELFIGTDKGLQSYRSGATYAEAIPQEEAYAFPNPVQPDYDGPIAIKGLTRDGLVHITDAAGHVVYATQALGGQALWYGRNHDGHRVASGTYYVFAASEKGDYKSVAKILVIH